MIDESLKTTDANALITVKTAEITEKFTPIKTRGKLRVIVITDGEAKVTVDGESASLGKNEIAVICPESILNVADFLQYAEITVNISPSQENAARYLPFINGNIGVPTFIKKGDACYAEIYGAVNSLLDGVNVTENIETLLKTLFDRRQKNADANMSKNKQRYAVELILQKLSDVKQSVVIGDVAEACGYSEFYAMKLFKQYTGETIVDYANKYRVYVAAQKLLSTDKTAREIAIEVGFANISYFNRQFKRMYGITPQLYRKTHGGN